MDLARSSKYVFRFTPLVLCTSYHLNVQETAREQLNSLGISSQGCSRKAKDAMTPYNLVFPLVQKHYDSSYWTEIESWLGKSLHKGKYSSPLGCVWILNLFMNKENYEKNYSKHVYIQLEYARTRSTCLLKREQKYSRIPVLLGRWKHGFYKYTNILLKYFSCFWKRSNCLICLKFVSESNTSTSLTLMLTNNPLPKQNRIEKVQEHNFKTQPEPFDVCRSTCIERLWIQLCSKVAYLALLNRITIAV